MIVSRWQAALLPSKEQVKMIFIAEGLDANEEILPKSSAIQEHRHPFDEVRMVVSGELLVNVSGNQLLLRSGDRIEIPSNTKHQYQTYGTEDCLCIVSQKPPL